MADWALAVLGGGVAMYSPTTCSLLALALGVTPLLGLHVPPNSILIGLITGGVHSAHSKCESHRFSPCDRQTCSSLLFIKNKRQFKYLLQTIKII